jgi:hypothetical protein
VDVNVAGIYEYFHISFKRPPAVLGRIALKRKWDFHTATKPTIPIAKKKEEK